MKRTLQRESKESEIAKGEAMRRDSEGGQIMVKLVGSVDRNAGSVSFPKIYPISLLALWLSDVSVSACSETMRFERYLSADWDTLSVFSLFMH